MKGSQGKSSQVKSSESSQVKSSQVRESKERTAECRGWACLLLHGSVSSCCIETSQSLDIVVEDDLVAMVSYHTSTIHCKGWSVHDL